MNKPNKRILLLILSVLIIGSLLFTLAACGGGSDDGQDDGTPTDNGTTQNTQDDTDDTVDSDTDDDDNADSVVSQARLTELFLSGLELTEYSYTIEMTSDFGTTVSKIWIKGDNMRIDNEQEGVVYTVIVGRTFSYTLDPTSKTAIGVTWDEGDVEGDEDYQNINSVVGNVEQEALKYLGKEDINGEPCYIIETMDLGNHSTVTLWIHQEYGITMRAEFIGTNVEENVTTEISDLQIGKISDDNFIIPSDYEILNWDSFLDLPEGMGTE